MVDYDRLYSTHGCLKEVCQWLGPGFRGDQVQTGDKEGQAEIRRQNEESPGEEDKARVIFNFALQGDMKFLRIFLVTDVIQCS